MRLKNLEKVPFAPVVGAMFGLVAAVLILATPGWLFERMVVSSGLPDLVSAAQPPLGDKARILAALLAFFCVGAFLAATIALIEYFVMPDARRANRARGSRIDDVEAEAAVEEEPAAAPLFEEAGRRPLFAESDLGAPFMSDEAIAHARDELVLDNALPELEVEAQATETIVEAQWEPVAEEQPEAEAEAVEPVAELVAEPLQNGAAEAAPTPEPAAQAQPASHADADDQSVAVLLDRLEKALVKRERRTGSAAPFPSDLSALRDALVGSESRH